MYTLYTTGMNGISAPAPMNVIIPFFPTPTNSTLYSDSDSVLRIILKRKRLWTVDTTTQR